MAHEEIGEILKGFETDKGMPPETYQLLLLFYKELTRFFPPRTGADFLRNARAHLLNLQKRMSKKNFAWGDEDQCIFRLIFENLNDALKAEKLLRYQVDPIRDACVVLLANEVILGQPPVKLPNDPGPAAADDHNMLTRLMHIAMLCANGDRFLLFLRNAPIDDREAPEDFRYFLGACMDRFFPVDSPAEVNEDTARWLLNLTKKFECVETVAKFLTSHMGALQKELAALPCDQLRKVITAMPLTATQRTHLLLHHIITQRRACLARRCANAPLAAEDDEPGPADEPEDRRAPPEPQEDGPEDGPCCSLWPLVDLRLLDMGHWQQIAEHHVSLPVHVATSCLPQLVKSLGLTEQQLLLCREELSSAVQRINDMQEQLLNAERSQKELSAANALLEARLLTVEETLAHFVTSQTIPAAAEVLQAARHGAMDTITKYIRLGGCLHVRGHDMMTLLHQAACEGHDEVVQTLIAAGADVNAESVAGWTALKYAEHYKHDSTAALLRQHLNIKN